MEHDTVTDEPVTITFTIDDELCRAVDRFAKLGDGKALTRSESIRTLVRIGLAKLAEPMADERAA
jgi:metal-responsive CopG/Arc/MetJ family transcriptional regulator